MCDFCEHDKKYSISKGWLLSDGVLFNTLKNSYCLVADDAGRDYYDSLKINFCPLCGRKLSEETKYSDPIRQTVKEVAEEMPALGKYDGDYAFPCGAFGYMDGLYRADFSCSNCGKRHEGVIYGTEIVCSCGKKIKTGS